MPAFEPKYESKPGWWMAKQLGKRLGLDEYFPWEDYAEKLDWQLQQVGSSLEEMQKIGVKNFPRKRRCISETGSAFSSGRRAARSNFIRSNWRTRAFDPMPVYTPPEPVPKGYYRLNYGRMPAHTFGKTTNNPLLFQLAPENQLWVNPLVANEWSIEERRLRASG